MEQSRSAVTGRHTFVSELVSLSSDLTSGAVGKTACSIPRRVVSRHSARWRTLSDAQRSDFVGRAAIRQEHAEKLSEVRHMLRHQLTDIQESRISGPPELLRSDSAFGPKPIRTISGFVELITRFEFDCRRCGIYFFERFEFFGVFKVQSHTMWPYMCLCCGLFVPT